MYFCNRSTVQTTQLNTHLSISTTSLAAQLSGAGFSWVHEVHFANRTPEPCRNSIEVGWEQVLFEGMMNFKWLLYMLP